MPVPTDAARAPMPRGFEFVRVLGGGGCGWVALARQSALDRLVAVKTLHGGTADRAERGRFEREGQALARLRDHRIVTVHAMAEVGDDLALVLEFVDGPDLQRVLDKRMLDGPALLRVLADTAAALDVAAAAGIVHRDVKPANVMVTADGRAKLTDFGIARLASAAGAFRTGGAVPIGTPRYMAPEQILDPARESPAGDAYSFTAMVYEILLGRPPFVADDLMQLLYAHTHQIAPAPRSLRPELSAAADDVLQAGLAKDPAARPRPSHMIAALAAHPADWQSLRAERPLRAPRATTTPPASDRSRTASSAQVAMPDTVPAVDAAVFRPAAAGRRRVPAAVAGAAAVLVVLLVVLVLLAVTR